jgi:hypothetical protein
VVEFGGKTYTDGAGASQPVTPDMLNNLQVRRSSPQLSCSL